MDATEKIDRPRRIRVLVENLRRLLDDCPELTQEQRGTVSDACAEIEELIDNGGRVD